MRRLTLAELAERPIDVVVVGAGMNFDYEKYASENLHWTGDQRKKSSDLRLLHQL